MPGVEFWIWVLTGAVALIGILSGTLWAMLRAEAKDHAELIKQKADADRLIEVEGRWKEELKDIKENNEKLIDKLQSRHDKELDALATRLGEQIKSTENNILTQMRLMFDMWKKVDKE